jgi:6-phosphogluconate dehydrogenase
MSCQIGLYGLAVMGQNVRPIYHTTLFSFPVPALRAQTAP